jgi:DHA1 family inner membrane transport protein
MPLALYALALAAFSIGTAEFVIAGLLPGLSSDLSVSIPTTGLLVTGYAVGVAIGGPILAILTARLPRKPMIVALMSFFVLGQVLCALAPSYSLLMAARVLVACGHGLFYGIATIGAASLVPPQRRGAALSLVLAGITVANILGVPGGTAIGNAFGWRMTFWAVGAVAIIATIAIAVLLPPDRRHDDNPASLAAEIRVLGHQEVLLSYVIIVLQITGALAFVTYQVPLLATVTGVPAEGAPLFLLLFGLGSIVGIFAGGRLADWKLMPSLIGILLLQTCFLATMLLAMHTPVTMGINMFIAGAVGFAFNTPVQSRILHAAREAPNLAATLVSTAFNIGIAAGAFVGAAMLNAGIGYQYLPVVGIVCSLVATGVAALSWMLERRATLVPA